MKIAVMGSGGVGGYFGARLAKGGADVAFVAQRSCFRKRVNGAPLLRGNRGKSELVPETT